MYLPGYSASQTILQRVVAIVVPLVAIGNTEYLCTEMAFKSFVTLWRFKWDNCLRGKMYSWGGRRQSRQVSWSDQKKDHSWLYTNPVHLLFSTVPTTHSFIQANSLHFLYSFLPFYRSAFWFTASHQSWHSPDFKEPAQAAKIHVKDRKLGTSCGV